MKKAILFLAACFCLAIAKAESVKYMTFQTTDGTEHSLSLSGGIDISFANGELVAKAVDGEFRAPLTEMRDMWFAVEATSIQEALTDTVAEGMPVKIVSTDGRTKMEVRWSQNSPLALPAGIYIVQAEGKTYKVIIKK